MKSAMRVADLEASIREKYRSFASRFDEHPRRIIDGIYLKLRPEDKSKIAVLGVRMPPQILRRLEQIAENPDSEWEDPVLLKLAA